MDKVAERLFPKGATEAEKEQLGNALIHYMDHRAADALKGKEEWVYLILPTEQKEFVNRACAVAYAERNGIANPVIVSFYAPRNIGAASIDDTAAELGISVTRVYALIKAGKLVRSEYGITRWSIVTYMATRKVGRPESEKPSR